MTHHTTALLFTAAVNLLLLLQTEGWVTIPNVSRTVTSLRTSKTSLHSAVAPSTGASSNKETTFQPVNINVPDAVVTSKKDIHFGSFIPPKDAAWVLATPLSKTITYEPMNDETTTMDLVTSIEPVHEALPKLWFITLHSQSLTRAAFKDAKTGVLHCLSAQQKKDVGDILSKRSGYHNDFSFSKREHCASKGLFWKSYAKSCEQTDSCNIDDDELLSDVELIEMEQTLCQMDVLPHADAYLKVKLLKTIPAGDHSIMMCEVVGFGQWDESCGKVMMKHNLLTHPVSGAVTALPPSIPLDTLLP